MNESYEWVLKIIQSSTTEWHFKTCGTIVKLFCEQYQYNSYAKEQNQLWEALRTRAHEYGFQVPYNQ